jgi:hypothetical protein
MHVRCKLAAFVLMSKEVSYDSEDGTGGLYGNVPFRADYLQLLTFGEQPVGLPSNSHQGPFP